MRSEHSVSHGILMSTYLAQHSISCILLNSAVPPNFKEKRRVKQPKKAECQNSDYTVREWK